MINLIMFGPNGTVAVFDETGDQVPEWQCNLLCSHLQKMLEAGVITADTPVQTFTGGVTRETKARDWVPG